MVFRRMRNTAAALSDPWPVINQESIIRRLMDGVLSAQTMGFSIGSMNIYQCYLQPPGPTPRPMAGVVIYAGTDKMLAISRATLVGAGRYLDLTPLQQKTLGVDLPAYLKEGQLPLWRQALPEGDEQPDAWVQGFGQMGQMGGVLHLDLAPGAHWFSVGNEKGDIGDILLRYRNLIYHLDDQNFPFGGHFIRLIGDQGRVFDAVADAARGYSIPAVGEDEDYWEDEDVAETHSAPSTMAAQTHAEQAPADYREPVFVIDYCKPGTLNLQSHPHLTATQQGYELSAILTFHRSYNFSPLRFYVVRKLSGWIGQKKAEYFACAGALIGTISYSEMFSGHQAAQRLASNTAIDLLAGQQVQPAYLQHLGRDTSAPEYQIRYFPLVNNETVDGDPLVIAEIHSLQDRPYHPVAITIELSVVRGRGEYLVRARDWIEEVDVLRRCASAEEAHVVALAKAYDLAQAINHHHFLSLLGFDSINAPRYPREARQMLEGMLRSIAQ